MLGSNPAGVAKFHAHVAQQQRHDVEILASANAIGRCGHHSQTLYTARDEKTAEHLNSRRLDCGTERNQHLKLLEVTFREPDG